MITAAEVIALGVVLLTLDIGFVALRCWIKYRRVGSLGIDDFFILVTLACVCALGGVYVYGAVGQGLGHVSPPSSTIDGINAEEDYILTHTKQLADIFNWMSPWTLGTAKLSVLFFYRTIFCGTAFNILSWGMIALVSLWMVVSFLFLILQCGAHVDYVWSSAAHIAQYCMSGFAIALPISATDVFTDLLILLLPIYWVWKLQMPIWKRVSICGVFLFGAVTIASSVLRLAEYGIVYPTHNTDPNQYAYLTTVIYYGVLEAGLCVIAACLPILGPLFTRGGRDRLRFGTRYRYKGSRELSGREETGGTGGGSHYLSVLSSRGIRQRDEAPGQWPSGSSQVKFVPDEAPGESMGLDTLAVGNSEAGEHVEAEDGILVTTGINHESYTRQPRRLSGGRRP